jgi:hypothetical protein
MSVEELCEDLALELAPNLPVNLRPRAISRGNRGQVSEAEFVAIADEDLPVVVAQCHRALTPPGCAAVVGNDGEMAFGVEESGERVRLGLGQAGGSGEPAADSRFPAGTPCHQDFRV